VFITDRGRTAHVLLTIEAYERIVGGGANIVELLAFPAADEVVFEPVPVGFQVRPADVS
jgi:hypothetical protein